jgi:hypothetical protein
MRLAFFLSLFIYPKDTARCGEASSPHDVIEVVIVGEKQKDPTDGLRTPVGVGVGFFFGQLEQIEFLGPLDSRPAIIDPQFVENVFGVGTKGVERHDQLLGNFRTA